MCSFRGTRMWLALVGALAAIVLAGGAASAEPIVIESHIGDRPDDAERYVAPVLLSLTKHGYSVGPDGVGAAYEQAVSRPGSSQDRATIYSFQGLVEEGWTAWYDARFDDAIAAITRAVGIYRAAPAAMIQGKSRREQYFQALVVLAMSRVKKGEQATGEEWMAELVRSFPGQAVSHDQYGPEAEKLYLKVAKKVAGEATGTLRVRVKGKATIYVNEASAGSKDLTKDLPPGTYRVLVKQGDQEGRVYTAVVTSGGTTEIEADADFDAALHTSPVYAGLMFVDEHGRKQHEAEYAARVAKVVGAENVVVLRFGTDDDGKRALIGTTIDAKGKTERTRMLALEPEPTVERLMELGAYLAGDEVPDGDEGDSRNEGETASNRSLRWLRWPMFGVGLAAVGTSAALFAIDGDCVGATEPDRTCHTLWHTKTPAIASGVAGLALIAGAVYWQLRGDPEPERRTAAAVSVDRSSFAVVVRGAF